MEDEDDMSDAKKLPADFTIPGTDGWGDRWVRFGADSGNGCVDIYGDVSSLPARRRSSRSAKSAARWRGSMIVMSHPENGEPGVDPNHSLEFSRAGGNR